MAIILVLEMKTGDGGNMRPQYYADEYRRYQTYVRNYNPQKPIQKICGGANGMIMTGQGRY